MPVFGLVLMAATATSAGLIVVLRPLLARYALARPNARSSHREPTPQGGGIAVVAAALVGLWIGVAVSGLAGATQLAVLSVAALALALVGVIDDIRGLGAAPRARAADAGGYGRCSRRLPRMSASYRKLPRAFEFAILLIGGVWFVNLVNFMDGIDWMTVAEVVPITAAIALLGLIGAAPGRRRARRPRSARRHDRLCAVQPPVARLFLGDVGRPSRSG
jgi:UDP-N-acetylmuramyl pentapeptide phosphotransferase/UDP-N-acetylglucosamine-1-phosphate transferase